MKIFLSALFFIPLFVFAKPRLEECAKPQKWATSSAQALLKNAGLLKNEDIDFSKTKVQLLSSEKKSKDLYHQIQKIVFYKKDGKSISVITENEASSEECSMSAVKVYVIERELGL